MTTPASDPAVLNPFCVATTGDTLSTPISNLYDARETRIRWLRSKAFRGAQFSADGTTITTQHEDQCLRSFVLPEHLLNGSDYSQSLEAHCTLPSASPIRSYALYPHFNLQDPATTVVACAAQDLPTRLVNAIFPDVVHAKYPLINPTTEAYIAPNSLTWTRDGSRLIAGSADLISIFDASYDGSKPFLQHKLAHGKRERKRYSQPDTCKGIVRASSISADGILAIGTLERNLALYTLEGAGECMTCLTLAPDQYRGDGITSLAWSPCGTYLLVAERQSDCIQIYDMRNTFKRVSCLTGRNATTTQLLDIDVIPTAEGFEVWAGGIDGCVRMWSNPGSVQDEQAPSSTLDLHRYPVSTVAWHPQGAVLATCTGRDFNDKFKVSESTGDNDVHDRNLSIPIDEPDNLMKIWTT